MSAYNAHVARRHHFTQMVATRLHQRLTALFVLVTTVLFVGAPSALAASHPSPKPVFNFNGTGKVPSQISGPFDRVLATVLYGGAAICIIFIIFNFIALLGGKKVGGKLVLAIVGAVILAGFGHFFSSFTSLISFYLG